MAWVFVIITAGPAAADVLDTWSSAPRAVASVLLWAAWGAALVASFAPRPLGLTVLRVTVAAAVLLALAAAPATTVGRALLAVAGTALAAGLAFTPEVGYRFVNGAAYGEERRFPLRVPPALLLGPVPLAAVLLVAGASAGPLLLADERWVPGCPGRWPWRCRWCGRRAGPSMPCRNAGRCWSPPGSSSRTR